MPCRRFRKSDFGETPVITRTPRSKIGEFAGVTITKLPPGSRTRFTSQQTFARSSINSRTLTATIV